MAAAVLSRAPSAPQRRSVPHSHPALRLLRRLLDQPVCRCTNRPGLNRSAVIRWCLKGGRSAPCSRSPSATSVPLGRDSFGPGAIRSQAGGGMSLSSKSQTGQRGENTPHTRARVRRGVRARPSDSCETRRSLRSKNDLAPISGKPKPF